MNTIPTIRELIKEVLEKSYLMSLGFADGGGVWVADVICVHDEDLNIYWMSNPGVRHSLAVLMYPKMAGTITVNKKGEDHLGIQFEGLAEKINGPRYDLAKKHLIKRGKPEPKQENDVLDGDSWYMLRPSKIELMCEKHFGFEKRKLDL